MEIHALRVVKLSQIKLVVLEIVMKVVDCQFKYYSSELSFTYPGKVKSCSAQRIPIASEYPMTPVQ